MMNHVANFKVYQASAGAGKTFTLIKEYLKLCLKNEGATANFQHILAITFTNAAANEMKSKIINNLCEIIGIKESEDDSMKKALMQELGIAEAQLSVNAKSLLTKIMHDYSSFCVCTIDAFVQKLSRNFARELGLPCQYTVSIDDDEMADTVVENLGMKIHGQEDLLTRSLADFSDNQFELERSMDIEFKLSEFIQKLLSEKAYKDDEGNQITDMPHYQETNDFLKGKEKEFEDQIKRFVDDFRAVENKYGLQVEHYWQKKNGVEAFIGKLSKGIYESTKGNFSNAIENRKCLGDTSMQEANEALLAVIGPLKTYYDAHVGSYYFFRSQRNLLYLYALRGFIRDEFEKLAVDDEVVHISEFNKRLNEVMGDFSVPFVYKRIGEHFHHIFVDEFQDTSVLQWQNLLPLVDNGLSSGGMSMVVGDGKQSIYRFRNGEVEQIVSLPEIYAMPQPQDNRRAAFEQYQRTLENNYDFTNLDTNYRSFENVVTFNNAFFEKAYTNLSAKSQKVYVDAKPGSNDGVKIFQKHAKQEKGLVQVELFDHEIHQDYYPSRIEAVIRELTEGLGYKYSDIAVLTRAKDLGRSIAKHLNDNGIRVVSQESILLKSSDKVLLLIYTLRYLIHDDDIVNVANLLFYWKLCMNPHFEGDVSHWFDAVKPVMDGETDIETLMGLKQGLLHDTLSRSTCLYDLCASLLRIYGFNKISDAFLNYFMEEVFGWQNSTMEGIEEFLKYWEKKKDTLSVKSVKGNAVEILTIHKSKGLEYPVVIYPQAITDLNEKLNNSKVEEEWVLPDEVLGFKADIPNLKKVLLRLDKKAVEMGGDAAQHVEKEAESNRLDNLNLLYVAFTRAKQRLYVMAPQKKEPKKKKDNKPPKMHLLQDFLDAYPTHKVPENESVDGVMMYRFGEASFRNPKEDEAVEPSVATSIESQSAEWFSRVDIKPDPTRLWQSEIDRLSPREFGEFVHQVLAKICTADNMNEVLSPFVADGTIDEKTAVWIQDRFMQMTRDKQIAPAFNSSAKVKTECEICYPRAKDKVIRLDRYAELPDAIYLIDYKTGKENRKHIEQVQAYADALREMTSKEIRAYLVYLSNDTIDVERVSV